MHRQRWPFRLLIPMAGGLLLLGSATAKLAGAAHGPQIGGPPDASVGGYTHPPQMGKEPPPPDPLAARSASHLEHMREDERRKRLQADAARLVEMSNALKSAVDNTSKDELSLDVVKRAAEIEKVARDLKDRMRS